MRTPCASIFVSEILQKQIYFTLVHILPIDAEQQISPRLFLLKYIFSFIFYDFASTDSIAYVGPHYSTERNGTESVVALFYGTERN